MKTKLIALLIMGFMMVNCDLTQSNDTTNEIQVTEKTAMLLKANNSFGFDLFKRVYAEDSEKNTMISPLSVSMALAMVNNGARGNTQEAINAALKFQDLPQEDINQIYLDLINALQSLDEKVLLEIANAIFYRDGFPVREDFINVNQEYFDAEVSALDFGSPEAVNTINDWVTEKTHDKITRIINEISPEHIMFLLNAIYFKGAWQTEFNEESTEKLPFTAGNGSVVEVETMQRLDTLPYMKNEQFSAIQLAYGSGNYNMYVFLPEPGKSVDDVVEELDPENWETWMDSFRVTEKVEIRLPRFKYGYEIKLNSILSEMGMGIAFRDGADFSGINATAPLKIDYVKHKSFIEVNEEGTEAAAVTIIGVELTSVGGSQKVRFYVDRPFLYAITEKDTGAILFMGSVQDPAAE